MPQGNYITPDTSSFFYIKIGLDGICQHANPAYYNSFVELRNNFVGRSFREIVIPEDVEKLEIGIAYCIENPGQVFSTDVRKPSSRGTNYYCYCEFIAETDDNGKPIGIDCTGFQLTNFIEAEKNAADFKEQYKQELSDYLEKFRQLSYLTSHELRHEYAKIQTILLAIENQTISQNELKMVMANMKDSINRLNVIISKLNKQLSFGRSPIFDGNEKAVYTKAILVDDDEVLNYLNKRLLAKHCPEIEVELFNNAKAALDYLKQNDKEGNFIIFLDLNMPILSGWDFLDQYKAYPIQSKVIILTSSIDIDDKLHARAYKNVMDFLPKPLTAEELNKIFDYKNLAA